MSPFSEISRLSSSDNDAVPDAQELRPLANGEYRTLSQKTTRQSSRRQGDQARSAEIKENRSRLEELEQQLDTQGESRKKQNAHAKEAAERMVLCTTWLAEAFKGMDLKGEQLHLEEPSEKVRTSVEQYGVFLGKRLLGNVVAGVENGRVVDDPVKYSGRVPTIFLREGFVYQAGKFREMIENRSRCQMWLEGLFKEIDLKEAKPRLDEPRQKNNLPIEQYGIYVEDRHIGDVYAGYKRAEGGGGYLVADPTKYRLERQGNRNFYYFLREGFEYQVRQLMSSEMK